MRRRTAGLTLFFILATSAAARAQQHAHWSYDGESGPAAWGRLGQDFALCSTGAQQSPIDLQGGAGAAHTLRLDYQPADLSVLNNGHTFQANVQHGGSLTFDGGVYQLLQFHYHRPSEHTVNGRHADAELHLVHRNADGQLAVLGILLDNGAAANAGMAALLHARSLRGEQTVAAQLNPAELLPANRAFATYSGSLTTPPCTEGVRWIVLEQHGSITAEQLALLDKSAHPNARPVMPLQGRVVETIAVK